MQQKKDDLHDQIELILNYDYAGYEEWERSHDPDGEIQAYNYLQEIRNNTAVLDSLPTDLLISASIKNEILPRIKETTTLLDRINALTKRKMPSRQEIESIRNEARGLLNAYFSNPYKSLSYPIIATNSFSMIYDKYRERVSLLAGEIEEKYKRVDDYSKEINSLVELAKLQVLTKRVSEHAKVFEEEKTDYQNIANRWLGASVIFAILTTFVSIGWQYFLPFDSSGDLYKLLPQISTKIIVLTLLISALVWCSKLYKSNLNLAIIYKHKADSLATFEEFAKAATNDVTKDYVLQETTRAIFSVPVTGLINQDPLPIESGTKIFEMVKGSNQ